MKRFFFASLLWLFSVSWLINLKSGEPKTGLIGSGGGSLKDVLREITGAYEKEHAGVHVLLNLGSTGELELQIRNGAKADIFAGAAPVNVERLDHEGLLTS